MKRSKRIVLFLQVLVLCALVTACGAEKTENAPESTTESLSSAPESQESTINSQDSVPESTEEETLVLEKLTYFEKAGAYGFMKPVGQVAFLLDCDSVSSFADGVAYVCVDGEYRVIDTNGNEVKPTAEQLEALRAGCADGSVQEYITSRQEHFYQWTKEKPLPELYEEPENIREIWRYYKIEDELFLYYYATRKEWELYNPSQSGLYTYDGQQVIAVLSGEEYGGSVGGNFVSFFRDTQTGEELIGLENHAGGFLGNAYGADIYRYENDEAVPVCSYLYINQSTGNYDEAFLLDHAEYFYDYEGNMLTRDNILDAQYVEEYRVNEEMVTREVYEAAVARYEKME